MKIAITGSHGLLGSELYNLASKDGFFVKRVSRNLIMPNLGVACIKKYLISLDCDVLVHCAANTNVEQCELNINACYRDNTLLSEVLAYICQELNMKFVFISSTGIYGSYKSNPYNEYDDVKPPTVHHRSKFVAEQRIQTFVSNFLIIRTGWLFGGSTTSIKNFIINRLNEASKSNGVIHSDIQQFGNPTYVKDVAERILLLLNDNVSGVFNCVNTGVATRYDYVKKIIKLSHFDVKVEPLKEKFQRVAPVSFNESALNFKMDELGYSNLPAWESRLMEYMKVSNLISNHL